MMSCYTVRSSSLFKQMVQRRCFSSSVGHNLSIRLAHQSNLELSTVTLNESLEGDDSSMAVNFVTTQCEIQDPDLHALQFAHFSKKKNSVALFYDARGPRQTKKSCGVQALVGLGDPDHVSEETVKEATNALMKHLKAHDIPRADLHLPTSLCRTISEKRLVQIMAQVLMLSNYHFDKYLTKRDEDSEKKKPGHVQHIRFVMPNQEALEESNTIISEQVVVAEETLFARDCGNERSDVMTPAYFEQLARKTASDLQQVSIRVLQQDELEATGLNLIIAVGQGAVCPPRMVILEYIPEHVSNLKKIALVGKGVTFDTGGLNLKPTNFIEDMHMDMCGAAAVLGAFRSAVRMKLQVPIVAVFPLAENAIDALAVKPHAIVQSLDGRTVEINNTDAEGRLILADALTYVQKHYEPDVVIDVATLTGACVAALGETTSGVFGNSTELTKELVEAGGCSGDRTWHLPIFPDHALELKGEFSDTRSTGKSKYAGASTAAAFLQQFIQESVAWAHLDIAGPASYSATRSHVPKGATGYGVQLLYSYLKHQAERF